MYRRKFVKNVVAGGIATTAFGPVVTKVEGNEPEKVGINELNDEISRSTAKEIDDTFETDDYDLSWWNTGSPYMAANSASVGWYGSLWNQYSNEWQHELFLSGEAACVNEDDDRGRDQFNGIKFQMQFTDEDPLMDYYDGWHCEFRDNERGLSKFADTGNPSIGDIGELGLDLAIPTLIGALNVPAGVAAGIVLSADNFRDALTHSDGTHSEPIDMGGIMHKSTDSYPHRGTPVIGYTQPWQIYQEPDGDGNMGVVSVTAKPHDEILDFLTKVWNQRLN